jgi:hypothetical protein
MLLGPAVVVLAACALAACTTNATPSAQSGGSSTTTAPRTTTTTVPCSLTGGGTTPVPVDEHCSSNGAPHFGTPTEAMVYLAAAWNSGNVRELDYVTDPNGRGQMNSMAAQMVNLQFKNCTQNPAGDYTCYFTHDIAQSTSSTTYPNPGGYPPGEAVFTVAPAAAPGWYLTEVIHCG